MEGVTLGMNYGLRRLAELGVKPTQIRATGGGAKSKVWRQIMADVFNAEVVTLKVSEGAAYGAALQALWCWRLQTRRKDFHQRNHRPICAAEQSRNRRHRIAKTSKCYPRIASHAGRNVRFRCEESSRDTGNLSRAKYERGTHEKLESHVAHLERQIDQLNEFIVLQSKELDRLKNSNSDVFRNRLKTLELERIKSDERKAAALLT